MAIDPSIIGGAVVDYSRVNAQRAQQANALKMQQMQLQQESMQIQGAQAQAQKQNAITQILQGPDAVDPKTGLPTANTLMQITKVDPTVGFKFQDQVAKAQTNQIELKGAETDLYEKKAGLQADNVAKALEAYDLAVEGGTPKEAAMATAQKLYSDGHEELSKSGIFSEKEIEGAPKKFDPDAMRSASAKYLSWKEKRDADKRAEKRLDLAEKKEDQRFAEAVRHDKAEEGFRGAELGIQRSRLSMERVKMKAATSGGLSDEAVQGLAEQVLAGNKQAIQGLGRGTQGAADLRRIENKVYEVAKQKGLSGKDLANATAAFAGEVAASRAISTQNVKLSAVEGAASNAAKMYEDAYKDLGVVSDVKALNAFVQGGQAATSDPKLKRALTAAQGLASEYASAMNRGGAPHVHDMEYARKLIVDALKEGPAANKAMVGQIRAEIQGVRRANERAAQEAQGSDYGERSGGAPDQGGWKIVGVK